VKATIIPDVVNNQTIRSLRTTDNVIEAAQLMREHDISSVVLLDEAGALVGIVTERYITCKVVAEDRPLSSTKLQDIMTPDPITVAPQDSPLQALQVMQFYHVRHILVLDEGQVVGIVSMRDLRANLTIPSL